jgi:hypothetical protein
MLEDSEAAYVLEPFSSDAYRVDIDEAKRIVLQRYFELTGFEETVANAIFHHVITQHGRPCPNCGKPLRTPRARWCAACGIWPKN